MAWVRFALLKEDDKADLKGRGFADEDAEYWIAGTADPLNAYPYPKWTRLRVIHLNHRKPIASGALLTG